MEANNRVTVHDVARLAGVSVATVSRALSGANPVAEETARRVRAAADRLGYRVDPLGKSLRRQETLTVGLAVADITNPFFALLIRSLEDALQAVGYGILLADAGDDHAREADSVERLLARRVDALLLAPCDRVRSRNTVATAARQVTTVQVDRFASAGAHYVGMDNDRAVADLITLLEGHGRRAPAFVGSHPGVSTTWERQASFVRRSAELDSRAPQRVLTGSFSYSWGWEAAGQIVERWPDVDSVVCGNDLIALGMIDGLLTHGRRVPDDVAVTGFDDTLFATLKEPSVTSVRHPLAEMAQAAVQLIPAVGGQAAKRPVRTRLAGVVVERSSTT